MDESLQAIRAILSSTPQRWLQLVEVMPAERLRLRPAPQEWSAVECLRHLIMTEVVGFSVRLVALRQNQDLLGLDPEQHVPEAASEDAAVLAATFANLRQQNLLLFDQVELAELSNSGIHSELGRVTLGELLNEWATHDLDHTIQAERALMQPFLRNCGPWQRYFVANRIDP